MQAEQNEGKFEPDLAQLAGAAQSRAREGCVCARACLRACVRVCVCFDMFQTFSTTAFLGIDLLQRT